jgi:hypothetical protein
MIKQDFSDVERHCVMNVDFLKDFALGNSTEFATVKDSIHILASSGTLSPINSVESHQHIDPEILVALLSNPAVLSDSDVLTDVCKITKKRFGVIHFDTIFQKYNVPLLTPTKGYPAQSIKPSTQTSQKNDNRNHCCLDPCRLTRPRPGTCSTLTTVGKSRIQHHLGTISRRIFIRIQGIGRAICYGTPMY